MCARGPYTYIILVKSFISHIFHILGWNFFPPRAFPCFIFHPEKIRTKKETAQEAYFPVRESEKGAAAHSLLCNIFTLFYYKSTKCTQRGRTKIKTKNELKSCIYVDGGRDCNFCCWQQKHIKRHKMHNAAKSRRQRGGIRALCVHNLFLLELMWILFTTWLHRVAPATW